MHRRNFERDSASPTESRARACRWVAVAGVAVGAAAAACGDDGPVERERPTPEAVRAAYGLADGNCYRYESGNLSADAFVEGPNTNSIIGRTVYEWSFRPPGGTSLETWFLDTESDGEILLLRSVTGVQDTRATRSYQDTDSPPVFYRVDLDRNGEVVLLDSKFETEVTPECAGEGCADPVPLEKHEWAVQMESVSVPTVDGMMEEGIVLLYRLTIGSAPPMSAEYTLVPGKGFSRIRTFAGDLYQVCNWRYRDADGNFQGAASCAPADIRCD